MSACLLHSCDVMLTYVYGRGRSSQVRLLETLAQRRYHYTRHVPILSEAFPLLDPSTASPEKPVVPVPPMGSGVQWVGGWRAHLGSVTHLFWVADNNILISASVDGLVRCWDVEVRDQ